MKKSIASVFIGALLMGCSVSSKSVPASYVSPGTYRHYDCGQIAAESANLTRRLQTVSSAQDAERRKDIIAAAAGVFVWPVWLALLGGDSAEELARLKGEREAVQTVSIEKRCGRTG